MKLNLILSKTAELLKERMDKIISNDWTYMPYSHTHKTWLINDSVENMMKSGTLSIGFIGLSEAVEVLTGHKMHNNSLSLELAYKIVGHMRRFVDELREKENLNFTLLATSGEMISGRFCKIDKNIFNHPVHEKGFYTNSFHVEVDSLLTCFKKIDIESPFHNLCNGGCITYVEFESAPLDNLEALYELTQYSIKKGISYLGFNYPMDICLNCNNIGTFDVCNVCLSEDIKRIRRVSGYLEDLDYFTKGKLSEVKIRKANCK
jgi:ribonucleoside-triphosphate reductase